MFAPWLKSEALLIILIAIAGVRIPAQTKNAAAIPAPHSTPHIEWNARSLSLIQSNGYYARIIRLQNGQLLCGFDCERKVQVRRSSDEGKTWQTPVTAAEWPHGRLTNAELLQLRDGSLLCFYNERPRRRSGKTNAPQPAIEVPYAVSMVRSDDNGFTWHAPQTLYSAGVEFTNGCWEPAAIQLPSGEVQLFFSSEGPYRNSDEQEITLLRSNDGARTWSAPEKISFRPGARDGMPVPLVLKNGSIAFSIEDNGLSGLFKPTIVWTSLADNWRSGVRGPASTNRWGALRVLPPPHVSASAPYLRQMPTGETVLSFQRSETGEMENAYMVVCIGDENARNFDSPSVPFPKTTRAQLWNSLFVKDKNTLVAVSETTINGIFGIWSIEGRLSGTYGTKSR
ncbi:MAG: hypothetical protein JWM68_4316 [Verrucomicrobiales bacterium]|nr:hypothetical protein [Verrucomicrobiales bacterium]